MLESDAYAEALRLLADAAKRSQRRDNVAYPPGFVTTWNLSADSTTTPLARLIQGGRGGEVRLKLYLLLTLMASAAPYDIRNPRSPQTLARTLGLPGTTGPRRISSNLRWLDRHQFLALERRTGKPAAIQLLDPLDPGKRLPNPRGGGRWVSIPLEFWSAGWILDLSPVAIAVFFALRERLGKTPRPLYLTRERRASYKLSHDTWTHGAAELVGYQLLTEKRQPQADDYDQPRARTAYLLDLERMKRRSAGGSDL